VSGLNDNSIKAAFLEIQADDTLVEQTAAYLNTQREQRTKRKRAATPWRLAGAFAMIAVLVIGISARDVYFIPTAHVSIDVNPSIELTLNRMNRVISTYAFNAEGEQMLSAVNLNGKPYDEAAALLVAEMNDAGYITDYALVSVSVQTADGNTEQMLCDTLLQTIHASVNTSQENAAVEVFPVSEQLWQEAHGCHMSPAKYSAIQELLAVDEEATLEDYSNSSIGQIRQRIRDCQSEHGNSGDSAHDGTVGSGQGEGHGHDQNGGHGHCGGQ